MPAEEVLTRLSTNSAAGLSEKEAGRRKARQKEGSLWQLSDASGSRIPFGEFFDLAAILLAVTAAVAALFDRGVDAVLICILLVVSSVFRAALYLLAQRVFSGNAKRNMPQTAVLRAGKVRSVPADHVAVGDILLLSAGDTVPCDARILSGSADVMEAFLEEQPVRRHKSGEGILSSETPCEARSNIVFASTTVLRGSVRAVVFAVGESTYAYARRGYIPLRDEKELQIVKRLSARCRTVSLIMLAAVVVLTFIGLLSGDAGEADRLFLSSLAVATASLSEFMCVIAMAILASSVRCLERDTGGRCVIKNADSVENAALADTVVIAHEGLLSTEEWYISSWSYQGKVGLAGPTDPLPDAATELLQMLRLCCGLTGTPADAAGVYADVPGRVFRTVRHLCERYADRLPTAHPPVADVKCTEKLCTVLLGEGQNLQVYVCGELRDVLECCSENCSGGSVVGMTVDERARLLKFEEGYRLRGIKTLAVARRNSPCSDLSRLSTVQNKMIFCGFVTAQTAWDRDLPQYVNLSRESGMRSAIFAKDSAQALHLAKHIGFEDANRSVKACSAEVFAALWREEGKNPIILSDLKPEEKTEVLACIRDSGARIMYVGDSLSDMAHFREADVCMAVNRRDPHTPGCILRAADACADTGSDRADEGHTPLTYALQMMMYCRNAMVNVQGMMEYLLFTQVLRLVMLITSVFFGSVLLSPVRLLIWGLLLDFIAVLTFSFRKNNPQKLPEKQAASRTRAAMSDVLFPCLRGVFCGLFIACVPLFLRLIGVDTAMLSMEYIAYMGAVLVSFAAAFGDLRDWLASVREVRYGAVFGVYLFLAVLVLLVTGASSGIVLTSGLLSAIGIALLPSAFVMLINTVLHK